MVFCGFLFFGNFSVFLCIIYEKSVSLIFVILETLFLLDLVQYKYYASCHDGHPLPRDPRATVATFASPWHVVRQGL